MQGLSGTLQSPQGLEGEEIRVEQRFLPEAEWGHGSSCIVPYTFLNASNIYNEIVKTLQALWTEPLLEARPSTVHGALPGAAGEDSELEDSTGPSDAAVPVSAGTRSSG